MCKITLIDKISFILVIIGAINWGLIGLLNVNIISILVGVSIFLQRLIYILIFAGSIDLIFLIFKCGSLKLLN